MIEIPYSGHVLSQKLAKSMKQNKATENVLLIKKMKA